MIYPCQECQRSRPPWHKPRWHRRGDSCSYVVPPETARKKRWRQQIFGRLPCPWRHKRRARMLSRINGGTTSTRHTRTTWGQRPGKAPDSAWQHAVSRPCRFPLSRGEPFPCGRSVHARLQVENKYNSLVRFSVSRIGVSPVDSSETNVLWRMMTGHKSKPKASEPAAPRTGISVRHSAFPKQLLNVG